MVDYFFAVVSARQISGIVISRDSVNHETVVEIALPRDGNSLSGDGGGFREALIAAGISRRHAGDQQSEIQIVPTVKWQLIDFVRPNCFGDLSAHGFDHRHVSRDVDLRRHASHFEL